MCSFSKEEVGMALAFNRPNKTKPDSLTLDLEKKLESKRRKKLRLMQVRQQSNDFAKVLRQTLQEEVAQQRSKLFELRKKKTEKKHLHELDEFNCLYQSCLQAVGESHREAGKQPNYDLKKQVERTRSFNQAAIRGVKAKKLQQEKQTLQRLKVEAPINQKKCARHKENLRSLFIASLPRPLPDSENELLSSSNLTIQNSPPNQVVHVLQNVPSNLENQKTSEISIDKEIAQLYVQKDIDTQNTNSINKLSSNTACKTHKEVKDSSGLLSENCYYQCIVCSCHQSPSTTKRRCNSTSSLPNSDISIIVGNTEATKLKTRSRSCSPRSVKALNYQDAGNLYESYQQNCVKVTLHQNTTDSQERNVNTTNKENKGIDSKSRCEDLKQKSEVRSEKALKKEELKKDFQLLLQDLKKFSKERAVVKGNRNIQAGVHLRAREVVAKKQSKQKKLSAVFEALIQTAKGVGNQIHGVAPPIEEGTVDTSLYPSLNLASYREANMYRDPSPASVSVTTRVTSCEEVTETHSPCPQVTEKHQSPKRVSPKPLMQPCVPCETTQRSLASSKIPPSTEISRKHKKKCKKGQLLPTDSSTSYFSPPENLTPSQTDLLNGLVKQICKKALSKDLKKYIKKLLSMSRESIDNLSVSSSVDCSNSEVSSPQRQIQEKMVKLGNLTELYADQVNTLVDIFEECSQLYSPEHYYSPPAPTRQKSPTSRRHPSPQAEYIASEPPELVTPQPYYLSETPLASPSRLKLPKKWTFSSFPKQELHQTPDRRSRSPVQSSGKPKFIGRHSKCHDTSYQRTTTLSPRGTLSQSPHIGRQQREASPKTPKHTPAQSPIAEVRKVGYPPGSAESRIPRLVSPQITPMLSPRSGSPQKIQTPFGLSSNLLPHPRDIFGQQAQSPFLPGTQCLKTQLSPRAGFKDESSFDPFQGLPPMPPTPQPSVNVTPSPPNCFHYENMDFDAELEKRGLADDFNHIRKLFDHTLPTPCSPHVVAANDEKGPETKQFGDKMASKSNSGSSLTTSILGSEEKTQYNQVEVQDHEPCLNTFNIRKRLNEVNSDHYNNEVYLLNKEVSEQTNQNLKNIFDISESCLYKSDKINKTKSLALLQALQLEM